MQKLSALLAIMMFAYAAPAMAQGKNIRAAIEAQNKLFAEGISKGNADAIAALYTKDGMVLPQNGASVQGQDAIKGMFQGMMASGIKGITLTTTEVEKHGNVANEIGTYSLKAADGKELDQGKYIVIWKLDGKQWKLHRDMFNTSIPAPQPAKPASAPAATPAKM